MTKKRKINRNKNKKKIIASPTIVSNNLVIDHDINACIFCLQSQNNLLTKTILLKNFYYYDDNRDLYVIACKCNVFIHTQCMNQWMQYKNACPICLMQFLQKPGIFAMSKQIAKMSIKIFSITFSISILYLYSYTILYYPMRNYLSNVPFINIAICIIIFGLIFINFEQVWLHD